MAKRLVLATRGSPLALAQTEIVAAQLRGRGLRVEMLPLTTSGDRWSASGGGPAPDKGLFVKELEEALLEGRADLAVHSAKDLPGDLPDGLEVLAVPQREDPRDMLVGHPDGLPGLPVGARVGTGSPRRAAQLRLSRPDLEIVPLRGNVGTRLAALRNGHDAVVLAAAGLRRLGLEPLGAVPLAVDVCTPAPGQGLLAIEGRVGDRRAANAVAALDDPIAHVCLRAERALLRALGGGCMRPIGAFCAAREEGLHLLAFAGAEEGEARAWGSRVACDGPLSDPEGLGREAAAELAAATR